MVVLDCFDGKVSINDFNYAGFMANNAQENFNAMHEEFGLGNNSKFMLRKKRRCDFAMSTNYVRQKIKLM